MTSEDIIHAFLDLHPNTPIDSQEYAVPLRMIHHMVEAGIKEGMKREHAMWVLAKIGQEIEHVHDVDTSSEHVHKAEENEHEYCDHGIRHNRHCKSCECIEQAEMRSEME